MRISPTRSCPALHVESIFFGSLSVQKKLHRRTCDARRLGLYAFWWLLFAASMGYSQQFTVNIRQFETTDGLLHRQVNAIVEDERGFIWLGLQNGVQRFDGRDFKTWSPQNGYSELFDITSLRMDSDGWLWIWNNTLKKFVFLNSNTDEVVSQETRFGKDFPIDIPRSLWINYLHLQRKSTDAKGRLIFLETNPDHLILYDPREGFSEVQLATTPEDTLEGIVAISDQDHVWIIGYAESRFALCVDLQGKTIARHDFPGLKRLFFVGQTQQRISLLGASPSGRELIELDLNHPEQRLRIPDPGGNFFFLDSLRWNLTSEGWEVYSADRPGELLFVINKGDWKQSLFASEGTMMQDSHGRIWFVNAWGLSRFEVRENHFRNFPFQRENGATFNPATRGLLLSGGNLIAVLEEEGVAQVALDNAHAWTMLAEKSQSAIDRGYFDGGPMIQLKEGGLLVGGASLRRLRNDETEQVNLHPLTDGGSNWALYEDNRQNIWFGKSKQLAKCPPQGGTEVFDLPPTDEPNQWIYQIYPIDGRHLWICTTGGLYLFDTQNQKVISSWGKGSEWKNYLPAKTFFCMYQDENSIYWLGTDEGLLRWDPKTNASRMFTTLDGLSSDLIYAIFGDEFNQIWMSSEHGLMRMDKTSHQVRVYLEKDGILYPEFNRISAYQSPDGTIAFGGIKGVTVFHPRDFVEETDRTFALQITDFEYFDGAQKKLLNGTNGLRSSKQITLQPDDGYFRLRFVLPNPDQDNEIRYAWRLSGQGQDWVMQKENFIQLAGLPYGEHTLQLKALENHGKWTETVEIAISVLRPFYLRSWFLVLMACIALIGIVAIFRRRSYVLRKRQIELEMEVAKSTEKIVKDKVIIEQQAEDLKSLDKAKSMFFANVSHEFRTPITLIQGPIGSLLKWPHLPEEQRNLLLLAQQNTQSLLKLVGAVLDLSKLESGKMEIFEQPVLLFTLTRRITATFESLMAQSKLTYIFEYEAEESLQLLLDAGKLETILKNLISNAAKFTPPGGQVKVKVEDLQNQICIQVQDSGRGIHPDDLPFVFDRFYQSRLRDAVVEGGTGIGLALCREFARLMGGEVAANSILGKGSTFTLRIPRKEVLGLPEPMQEDSPSEFVGNDPSNLPLLQQQDFSKGKDTRKTLMIVEDNTSLREYLQLLLTKEYNLYLVENGKKALGQLTTLSDSELPDLILSDIMMPEMDGYQLLEKLKSDEKFWRVPVIMLTARADIQDKLRALRIGVDDYLLKPFDEEELLARISNLLRNAANRLTEVEMPQEEVLTPVMGEVDQRWLEKLEATVLTHLHEPSLSVAGLADEFAMSESTFLRQVKRLTGLTPSAYLNEHKLNRARHLLETGAFSSIGDIAFEVGFEDAKSFARSFKARFGKSPSSYQR